MNHLLLAFAGLATSFAAHAAESCAVQAARLMAQEKFVELSGMFTLPSEGIARDLAQLSVTVGPIEKVLPLARQSAGESVRQTVAVPTLAANYQFDGSWAVATTRNGARFEFQASSESGSPCKLLALHVGTLAR